MPAGHLLAVLLLASGAGAVEVNKPAQSCHADGSCVGDDGMLFQLGRRVSAKGEETLHTSGMVSKLEDLANKVIDGTEKITPATREALETIDDEMDSVISNAEQNQKDFQGSVDLTKQSIETCGTDATTAHTNDGGINNLAAAVSNARTAHNTCRSSEATLKQDDNTKCKDFDDYVGDLKMPSCSCSTGQSLGIVGFKNCVAEMTSWSSTANTTWADKETLCKDAKSTHAAERISCNTKQGSLESDFCAYNTALRMTCSAQDSCRATQKALRETAHASIAVSESAFKAEYESAKHVKCILKVLNATDEVKREMLTACTSKTVDTDHLNITYHEVPDPARCDLTPVATKPCDQEWTDEEFQGKTWLTDAPLNSCVSCPAVGGATTSAPTAATSTDAAAAPAALFRMEPGICRRKVNGQVTIYNYGGHCSRNAAHEIPETLEAFRAACKSACENKPTCVAMQLYTQIDNLPTRCSLYLGPLAIPDDCPAVWSAHGGDDLGPGGRPAQTADPSAYFGIMYIPDHLPVQECWIKGQQA